MSSHASSDNWWECCAIEVWLSLARLARPSEMSLLNAAHHWSASDRLYIQPSPLASPLVKSIASCPSMTTWSQWPPSSPKSPSNQCPIRCKHVHTSTGSYLLIRSLPPAHNRRKRISLFFCLLYCGNVNSSLKQKLFFKIALLSEVCVVIFFHSTFLSSLIEKGVILSI